MPDVMRIPSLTSKGFEAKDALEVLLREIDGAGDTLARLDEALAFERQAFALGGRTRDCVALFNQNVALLQEQKEALFEGAKEGVINSLRRGTLIAFGYRPPVAPGDRRRVIDPRFWDFLRIDYETGEARGGGRQYVGIRMVKFDDLSEAERDAIGAELRGSGGSGRPEAQPPSYPGRPSQMKAVAEKMRERAARGELLPSLRAESRFLETWASREFPGHQTPRAKSIYNALGPTYRSLRNGKATGN